MDFIFTFPVSSDVATTENIDISLYDKGCRYNEGEPPIELLKGMSEIILFPDLSAESTAAMVVTRLEVTLGSNGMNVASMLREYPSLWDEEKSQIKFCFRFSLTTTGIEVNFVETVVTLDVTLDGVGFKIDDAAVQPKEKIESISRVSYDVKAYLCDGRYRPLEDEITGVVEKLHEYCDENGDVQTYSTFTETTTTTEGEVYEQELSNSQKAQKEKITYPQGSVVRVCIRPDDTALGQVSMRAINKLYFEGTVTPGAARNIIPVAPTTEMGDGFFKQYAVEEGTTTISSGLSVMSCDTNRMEGRDDVVVCAIDTMLVAAFYWRQPGVSATVGAYGTAALKFGTSDSGNPSRERGLGSTAAVRGEQPAEVRPHEQRKTGLLESFWNMTRPDVDYADMNESGGGFDFNLEYILSDGITSDMIQLEVWKKSCQQTGEEPLMMYTSTSQSTSDLLEMSSTDAYETGYGYGTQMVTVNGQWKRENPDFAPTLVKSEYYKESADGFLVQISLCVRYQLHTKPCKGDIEVNFLETPVIINIDMKAGIEFGVGFSLISDEDECLEKLQRMSSGGLDDLYSSGIFWSPGAKSGDPSMPLGPPISALGSGKQLGSSTYGASPYSKTKSQYGGNSNYMGRRASAHTIYSNQIGSTSWWTAVGAMIYLVLSLI